jgi:hypothetical protein
VALWVAALVAERLKSFVIPRRAARRGISLFLRLKQREIPHFVRNDKIEDFFRGLFSRDIRGHWNWASAPEIIGLEDPIEPSYWRT